MTKKFLSVTFSEFKYAIQPVTDTKQFINLGDPGINFCIVSVKSWITAQVTMNTQISQVWALEWHLILWNSIGYMLFGVYKNQGEISNHSW